VEILAMIMLSAGMAVWLACELRTRRKWDRWRKGLCPGCGYDLRMQNDRCPECGRPVRWLDEGE